MSAGHTDDLLPPSRDLSRIAPLFRTAVERALAECAAQQLDAFVYEAYRPLELQRRYYARGRTVVPPPYTVTYARDNLHSWHGFGLAVDVISRADEWDARPSWFTRVSECFSKFGCRWGGEWKMKDLPHFQWKPCRPIPSDRARALIAAQGVEAVWRAVGAM